MNKFKKLTLILCLIPAVALQSAAKIVNKLDDQKDKHITSYNESDAKLKDAAIFGKTSVVKKLFDDKVMVNAYAVDTALSIAAYNGHSDIVEILIKAGAKIDYLGSEDGRTPLIDATIRIHKNVVQLLLSAGADLTIQDNEYKNALYWAREYIRDRSDPDDSEEQSKSNLEIIKLLEDEPRRRISVVKKRHETLKKLINNYFPPVLTSIILVYAPAGYKDIPYLDKMIKINKVSNNKCVIS